MQPGPGRNIYLSGKAVSEARKITTSNQTISENSKKGFNLLTNDGRHPMRVEINEKENIMKTQFETKKTNYRNQPESAAVPFQKEARKVSKEIQYQFLPNEFAQVVQTIITVEKTHHDPKMIQMDTEETKNPSTFQNMPPVVNGNLVVGLRNRNSEIGQQLEKRTSQSFRSHEIGSNLQSYHHIEKEGNITKQERANLSAAIEYASQIGIKFLTARVEANFVSAIISESRRKKDALNSMSETEYYNYSSRIIDEKQTKEIRKMILGLLHTAKKMEEMNPANPLDQTEVAAFFTYNYRIDPEGNMYKDHSPTTSLMKILNLEPNNNPEYHNIENNITKERSEKYDKMSLTELDQEIKIAKEELKSIVCAKEDHPIIESIIVEE